VARILLRSKQAALILLNPAGPALTLGQGHGIALDPFGAPICLRATLLSQDLIAKKKYRVVSVPVMKFYFTTSSCHPHGFDLP
jgi:hypothetical protein